MTNDQIEIKNIVLEKMQDFAFENKSSLKGVIRLCSTMHSETIVWVALPLNQSNVKKTYKLLGELLANEMQLPEDLQSNFFVSEHNLNVMCS